MMWPHNGTSTTPQQVKKKKKEKKNLNSCFVAEPLMVFSFQGYLPSANLYSLLEYVHQYREDLAFR